MKKTLLLLICLIVSNAFSQITNEGKPLSWKLLNQKNNSIKAITLPSFDLEAVKAEDQANQNMAKPWRFGYMHSVDYGLEHGKWTELENGDRIWRIKFHSPEALSLNVIFDNFFLPEGGSVYLYNEEKTDLLGAYTNVQNQESGILGTWLVKGETLWIEYYEPLNVKGQGSLRVKKITHGYRNADTFNAERALGDSGDCNIDVECSVGSDWEGAKNNNKKAVGILLSGGSGFCTGALINNTSNDGTPYFLTADHCYSNPSAWAFRFGWISPDPVCATTASSTDGPTNMTISGATLRARNANSDVCLVEINSAIPSSWNRTWAGWNKTGVSPNYSVGIHHPAGDIMKICRDNSPLIQATNAGALTWEITSSGQGWELGVTEPGSSGSPLFDDQGNIIGQLYGGGAACSGTVDNNQFDYYGRFDISWDAGATAATRLKDWLDPTNANPDILEAFPALQANDFDIASSVSFPEVECGTTDVAPIVNILNLGVNTLTTATITWSFNGGPDNVLNYSGSLAQYESEDISLPQITLVSGDNTITVTSSNPNNMTDENTANNTGSDTYLLQQYNTTLINFDLFTDNYGSETTWEFLDASNTILFSGGPYENNAQQPTVTFPVDLGSCYSFVIYDSFGDGICCDYGSGLYELTTDDNTVIFSGGLFQNKEITGIQISESLRVDEFLLDSLVVLYPNPTSNGVLNITLNRNTTNNLSYTLISTTGQIILDGSLTNGENTVNVSAISSGVYFVKIQDESSQLNTVKKVVIN